MADKCWFCGCETDGEFKPEHWVPKWLSRELRKRGYVPEGDDDLFNMTVPHVCGSCNSGWMSDIETRSKKHVLPLILGDYSQPIPAPVQAVEHIVRWSYLKVISLELGRPEEHQETLPPQMYANFKSTRLPAYPNSSVAIGAREPITETQPTYIAFTSQSLNSARPGGEDVDWHQTSLFVGHLVITLIVLPDGGQLNARFPAGFQPIWPLIRDGGRFVWPPEERLSLETLIRPT